MLVRLTETSEKIQIQIASDAYRPCSIRASVLYFVLNDGSGAERSRWCWCA